MAIRLGRLLLELMPGEPDVQALAALMLLQHARRDARSVGGRLLRLPDQDRALWRRDEIEQGLELIASAARRGPGGTYLVQALIAAEHARPAGADWRAVAALYARLEELRPSPIVRLNRAVAVAEADGPAAGLRLLEGLDDALAGSHQLPAARAELLRRLNRMEEARAAYDRALELAGNEVVRAHLREQRFNAR